MLPAGIPQRAARGKPAGSGATVGVVVHHVPTVVMQSMRALDEKLTPQSVPDVPAERVPPLWKS